MGNVHVKWTARPIPIEQSIYWKPLDDSYHLLAATLQDGESNVVSFMPQRVIAEVCAMARRTDPEAATFGLILGHLMRCPRTGVRYSTAESLLHFGRSAHNADRTPPSGWPWLREAVADAPARHGATVLGWYDVRDEIRPRLSESDERMFEDCFREPWQVALVVGTYDCAEGAMYGFSRKAERSFQSPFYEMVAKEVRRAHRNKPTWIEWPNYVTDEPFLARPTDSQEAYIAASIGTGVGARVKGVLSHLGLWRA